MGHVAADESWFLKQEIGRRHLMTVSEVDPHHLTQLSSQLKSH